MYNMQDHYSQSHASAEVQINAVIVEEKRKRV